MKIIAFTDGASQGNPGPSGIGIVLFHDTDTGQPLFTFGDYVGEGTNNTAEYKAIVRCLRACLKIHESRPVTDLEIRSDAQSVVRQITGEYGCYTDHLIPLLQEVKELFGHFPIWRIKWIGREENELADALSRRAILARGPVRERRVRRGTEGVK